MQKSLFKVALCQIKTIADKSHNLRRAEQMIREAASNGADLIVLPEMFTAPFTREYMLKYKEPLLSDYKTNPKCETSKLLSSLAQSLNKYIIGGSFPEEVEGSEKIFNTCLCFNREGDIVAQHRKLHLFDINIPGGVTFYESDYVQKGPPQLSIFETEYCKISLGICYDIRFPEYAQLLAMKGGADILCYPANFAMRTGELHFEILRKARAVDNQSYVIVCSCATNTDDKSLFQSWGHSAVISPWGKSLVETEFDETILYQDINLDQVKEAREQIWVRQHKRGDIYELNSRV